MTPDQYIEKVDKFISNIEQELNGCVLVAANSLGNSIAQRITSTGTDERGNKYKQYSIGWAKYRQSRGAQTDHRSLFLTGEMWNSFKAKPSGTLECIVEFNNSANRKKAQDNAKIIGDFIQPNEKEIELAYEAFDEQLQKVIERIGL